MGLWTYRGLQLLVLGLTVHLLTTEYERFLQVNKCPFCKADVPDGADLCPHCYRSLVGYQGIDMWAVVGTAAILFLVLVVFLFAAIPYPRIEVDPDAIPDPPAIERTLRPPQDPAPAPPGLEEEDGDLEEDFPELPQ